MLLPLKNIILKQKGKKQNEGLFALSFSNKLGGMAQRDRGIH